MSMSKYQPPKFFLLTLGNVLAWCSGAVCWLTVQDVPALPGILWSQEASPGPPACKACIPPFELALWPASAISDAKIK